MRGTGRVALQSAHGGPQGLPEGRGHEPPLLPEDSRGEGAELQGRVYLRDCGFEPQATRLRSRYAAKSGPDFFFFARTEHLVDTTRRKVPKVPA